MNLLRGYSFLFYKRGLESVREFTLGDFLVIYIPD